ncbi:MAG TPA: cytochrome c biogenesis protein CcsA [Acidobacteriaceae bacterium]|nr:cytochrome c biogenesis protein CcsA [Acidobacteriaceae bacterium]
MKKLLIFPAVLGILALMAWGFYQAIYIAPTEATMGEVQRIFYYHVPHGILCYLFFSINFVASMLVLAWRRSNPAKSLAADAWALAGAEVGTLYCTINLVTGPLWARPVWGIWWTWDARLTTSLILWLIYVSYLLVRRFAAGSEMQALAAVLAVFGALDMPINYLANRIWRTQHPSPVIGGGPESGMAPPIAAALGWNVLAWAVWGLAVLAIRIHLERRQQAIDNAEAVAALAAD